MSTTGKLAGRRILLTGATRGIGREITKLFLAEGAEVIGAGKDASRLRELAETMKGAGALSTLRLDLDAPGFEQEAVRAVAERWGAFDILFNNAAIMYHDDSFASEPVGALAHTLRVNVVAQHELTLALLPALQRGNEPRIIFTSSGAGCLSDMTLDVIRSYRVSKYALNGLTMQWATELKGKVAVNALDPGWVKTDLGGPNAPGTPDESARGALALATMPFELTGKFWRDAKPAPF